MTSSVIVSRYASALADVVTGPSGMDTAQVVTQLRSFEVLLSGSVALQNALATPAVAAARKRAVVRKLADRLGLDKIARNFLLVLTDHSHLGALTRLIDAFEIQLDERLGFVRAEISSARDLEERQKTGLAEHLSRLTGKKVRARYAVDPELIGGVVARIGSTVYDGSVRGQLNTLGRKLATE
jgi:F-type H+-transporting ATPase subunit delta